MPAGRPTKRKSYFKGWLFHEARKLVSATQASFATPLDKGWRLRLYALCEKDRGKAYDVALRFIMTEKAGA